VLTGRLEQLVREVLITIKNYGGSNSLKIEYRLNPLALELEDILNNLDR
jgi:DNA-binding HxlR family transcriptional regulator